jgi:hypothetical protein
MGMRLRESAAEVKFQVPMAVSHGSRPETWSFLELGTWNLELKLGLVA